MRPNYDRVMPESAESSAGRRFGPPPGVVLWVPVLLSFVIQVVPMVARGRFGMAMAHAPNPRDVLFGILIMLVGPVALIAARRFPGPVVAVVAAAAATAMLLGRPDWPPYIALAFALVSAIVRGARAWAWISVGAAWIVTLLAAISFGITWQPPRIAGVTLGILIAFGIGEGIRTRRERAEGFRKVVAQRRMNEMQAERVRLARELHDVLAHSLSQINVQAGVGLHLMESQPQKAADALASIKLTSKTALDEVRSVLGVLRADGDPGAPLVPEPDLSRLPGLAASVTEQGVMVTLSDTITVPPSSATQLAIYRIVQESLTNVLRHAKATTVAVTLTEERGEYLVTILDNGTGTPRDDGSGRGLLGMRERAELLGGRFTAGRHANGGFEVSVRVPKTEPRP